MTPKRPSGHHARSQRRRGAGLPALGGLLVVLALVADGPLDSNRLVGGLDEVVPEQPRAPTADLKGVVTHVRDGDTIEVAGTPVRIANLDCAEVNTSEGQGARGLMVDLVRGQTVTCELEGRKSHDRKVGTCALASAREDLGEILIGEGVGGRWR